MTRRIRPLAITLALLAALTGCTAAPVPDGGESRAEQPLPDLDAAIDRLPARIEQLLAETGVPGLAVAVVHQDETVYAEGFGTANMDTGAPVDADTVFQLASVSKPVGASVISALIGEGAVSWETPVVEELPWFALADADTTAQLQIADFYSHRTGLPDHAGDDLSSFGVDRRTIQERLRYLPLTPLRTEYAYTNFGIQTAAMAAAAAAGGDWSELSAEKLYEPLGMDRTTSRYEQYVSLENHAVGHSNWSGDWQVTPEQLNDDIATAAGGVASSVADLSHWVRMLLAGGAYEGEQIVDAEALAEAMVPQMVMPMVETDPAQPRATYGRGFQIGVFTGTSNTFVSHSGAFSQGAGTIVALIPALDIGVVVLTNGFPIGLAEAVSMEVLDWAQNGELTLDWWGEYRRAFAEMTEDFASTVAADPPASAAPPASAEAYVGDYRSDYFGDATVTASGDELRLTISPTADTGQTWVLEPYDGNVFRVQLDNVDASPESVSAVTFDPTAGTVTFEFFDHSSGGAGTFARAG